MPAAQNTHGINIYFDNFRLVEQDLEQLLTGDGVLAELPVGQAPALVLQALPAQSRGLARPQVFADVGLEPGCERRGDARTGAVRIPQIGQQRVGEIGRGERVAQLAILGLVHVEVTASNCVQCGAITAKGGRLTPPEGGSGPEYSGL